LNLRYFSFASVFSPLCLVAQTMIAAFHFGRTPSVTPNTEFLQRIETGPSLYLWHLCCIAQGAEDTVHDASSIAATLGAQDERAKPVVGSDSKVDVAVRQFFRPYVLRLVALVIIVGGWSYGYKLSQYLQHPEVSRASVTRILVEHRDDSVAVSSDHRIPSGKLQGLALLTDAAPRLSHQFRDQILSETAPAREAFIFSSLIPFRAPPTNSFLA
jgi:hypothetical protein